MGSMFIVSCEEEIYGSTTQAYAEALSRNLTDGGLELHSVTVH